MLYIVYVCVPVLGVPIIIIQSIEYSITLLNTVCCCAKYFMSNSVDLNDETFISFPIPMCLDLDM